MMKSPVFIFSLPRSGSTMLQRVLMSHCDIASSAEPWILLHLIYSLNQNGMIAEYAHDVSSEAIQSFIESLPNNKSDYFNELGNLATNLYNLHCKNNEVYFLDKTPRYHLIIPEIEKMFPTAKFIFLFRNPVQVLSSIIQTWGNGLLYNLHKSESDLKDGPANLSKGYELLKAKSIAIQYEEYVSNPEYYNRKLCDYLDISYDHNMHHNFIYQNTRGRMGDPSGILEYDQIKTDSLNKWKDVFNTPFRKKIVYDYINSIGSDLLLTQGYDKKSILADINSLCVGRNRMRDRIDYLVSATLKIISIKNHKRLKKSLISNYTKITRI